MEWTHVALYLASCVAAFLIVSDAQRMIDDIKLPDLSWIVFVSLFGPVTIVVGAVMWVSVWNARKPYKERKIIWRKKCK